VAPDSDRGSNQDRTAGPTVTPFQSEVTRLLACTGIGGQISSRVPGSRWGPTFKGRLPAQRLRAAAQVPLVTVSFGSNPRPLNSTSFDDDLTKNPPNPIITWRIVNTATTGNETVGRGADVTHAHPERAVWGPDLKGGGFR